MPRQARRSRRHLLHSDHDPDFPTVPSRDKRSLLVTWNELPSTPSATRPRHRRRSLASDDVPFPPRASASPTSTRSKTASTTAPRLLRSSSCLSFSVPRRRPRLRRSPGRRTRSRPSPSMACRRALRLHLARLLTHRAIATNPADPISDLVHAPVWGLVRSAQSENPDCRILLVDSDDSDASRDALPLSSVQTSTSRSSHSVTGCSAFHASLLRPPSPFASSASYLRQPRPTPPSARRYRARHWRHRHHSARSSPGISSTSRRPTPPLHLPPGI